LNDSYRYNADEYQSIFENALEGIFQSSMDEHFLKVNPAMARIFGYDSPDDMIASVQNIGEQIYVILNDRTRFVNALLDEGHVDKFECQNYRKDGSAFWVQVNARIAQDNEGKISFVEGFVTDITSRKEAEEALRALQASEERFRLFFQTSPDAININRLEDGVYVDVNEGFTSLTGYTREEALGIPSLEIDIWEDKRDRDKLIDGLRKKGFVNNLEAKFRMKDGCIVTGLLSARVIALDDVPHIISITKEIETLKQAEDTLQRQLKELTILHNIATAASSSTSVDELLQHTTDIITDALFPANCGIELVTEKGQMYQTHPSYRGASEKEIRSPMPFSRGVIGKVITTGIPIRLGDVSTEPAYVEATKGVQSELCVPIKIQGRAIGVINIESKKENAYDEADERLFNTIAGTLASSIEQLRLFETSQRRLKELSIINAVSLSATRVAIVDDLVENITQIIGDSLYPDNFGVILLNETGDMLHPHPSYRGINIDKFPDSVPINQGVCGQVAARGKSLRIADVRNHKGYIEATSQVRSELCVPIMLGENILGVINAESIQIGFFTEDDERLLTTIASILATALEKLRLLDQEKKRREDAETLREATTALTVSLDLSTLFETILEHLSRIVAFDSASIAMQESNELRLVAGRGFPEGYDVIGSRIKSDGKWSAIDQKRSSIIISDAQADLEFEQWEGSEYIRSWMAVAMAVQGKIVGYLFLDSRKPGYFSQRDATMVETFASSAAVTIENARLFEAEQQRRLEAETLREAATTINSAISLDTVLETVARQMTTVLGSAGCAISIWNRTQNTVTVLVDYNKAQSDLTDSQGTSYALEAYPFTRDILENQKISILHYDDLNAPETELTLMRKQEVYTLVLLPLVTGEQTIGLLELYEDKIKRRFYSDNEIRLIEGLASHAAIAIENARLFEAEQQRHRESETLRQATEAITSTLDIQQVLASILDNLSQVVSFESASVFLIENNNVRMTAVKGLPEDVIDQTFPADNAVLQEIWRTKSPLILNDSQIDVRFESWVAGEVHGWMGVPLIVHGVLIGYITIDSNVTDAYNEHDAALATTFANQAAVAIENARLFERGEQQIRQLTILRDIDSAISSSFDLRVTLNLLIGHIIRELDVDAAAIFLYNSDSQALSLYASAGLNLKRNAPLKYGRIGESLAGQVALQRKFLHIPNLEDVPEDKKHLQEIAEENFTSYFGYPLVGKGQVKGVLEIYTRHEIDPPSDWLNFLHILAGQAAIAIDNIQLFKNLQRSNLELTLAYDVTLEGWGRALELRHKETQGHTNRVAELTVELARHIGIGGEELTHIMRGALLHDIGKLGIPDSILLKPGPLTKEEWDIMRQHPQYAHDLINPIAYLRPALDIPYGHHERWDGSGYPRGLKGESIPLAARIFAVVDIWDALLDERVYRNAWSEGKVIEYLKNTAGVELDPNIVEKFLELLEEKHSKNDSSQN